MPEIMMSTNIEGVYEAGNSIAKRFRQVTTAVCDGPIAALVVIQYLFEQKTINNKKLAA